MSLVPIPATMAVKIADRSRQLAREKMKGYGWSNKSIDSVSPMGREGWVGLKTTTDYLIHQETGFKPFLMWWVQDRTLPMGCKKGDGPHFRRGSHVGEPGMVNIPHVGQVWREQRWKHPGLQPKKFLENSIREAVNGMKPEIQARLMEIVIGKTKNDGA